MSTFILVISKFTGKEPQIPSFLNPSDTYYVHTYTGQFKNLLLHNPEDKSNAFTVKVCLPLEISDDESISLKNFFQGLINTYHITDILIPNDHPLLPSLLAQAKTDSFSMWIAVEDDSELFLEVFQTKQKVFWLCDSIIQVERLLFQGITASQIVYPYHKPPDLVTTSEQIYALDRYLRARAQTTLTQVLNPETLIASPYLGKCLEVGEIIDFPLSMIDIASDVTPNMPYIWCAPSELNQAFALENSRQDKIVSCLGPYVLPKMEMRSDLDSEKSLFCVLQIDLAQDIWKPLLNSFLKHFELNPDISLVIVPPFNTEQDEVAALYEQLLEWFEIEQIDSEKIPEIIVLDPTELSHWIRFPSPPLLIAQMVTVRQIQACLQVLRDGGVVVSFSSALNRQLDLIQAGEKKLPASVPAVFSSWLESLPGATYYSPNSAAVYLWNQALLRSAWESLKKG